MLTLQNGELRIDVLDPVADATRLGPRYCWGGYIWQVHDVRVGPLLTGPQWPEPAPSTFNGQGLPESFRHRTLDGQPLTWRGDTGVALGAGELRFDSANQARVLTPCRWEIAAHETRIEFNTHQAVAGFRYALMRQVVLADREVCSVTRLTNLSPDDRLTLEWFAHPFFALVDGLVHAELPAGTHLAENPGFALDGQTLAQKRRFADQNDGHMERGLQLSQNQPLLARLAHSALTHVEVETSFVPDSCVIWGNDRTFSFEPYLTLDLAPGESREWNLRYRFGESSGMSASSVSSRIPAA